MSLITNTFVCPLADLSLLSIVSCDAVMSAYISVVFVCGKLSELVVSSLLLLEDVCSMRSHLFLRPFD